MKKKFILVFFLFYLFFQSYLYAGIKTTIIAKVGNEIITSFEIKNRILGTLIVSNNEINQSNIDSLKEKVLNDLINLKLKKNELSNRKIELDKKRVAAYLDQISSNDQKALKKKFENFDLNYDLFVDNIETEFRWRQFIFRRYSNKIEIEEEVILSEIDKILKNQISSREVNLSEIQIINSDTPLKNDEQIVKILNEIKNNGFEDAVLKFSISSTASNNGNLGWINVETLSKSISEVVSNMKPGDTSEPIVQANSILFIKLNEERVVSKNDFSKEQLKKNLILQKQNEMFNLYSLSHLSTIKNKYLIEYK